jgi:hypothetical protein
VSGMVSHEDARHSDGRGRGSGGAGEQFGSNVGGLDERDRQVERKQLAAEGVAEGFDCCFGGRVDSLQRRRWQ